MNSDFLTHEQNDLICSNLKPGRFSLLNPSPPNQQTNLNL